MSSYYKPVVPKVAQEFTGDSTVVYVGMQKIRIYKLQVKVDENLSDFDSQEQKCWLGFSYQRVSLKEKYTIDLHVYTYFIAIVVAHAN